MDKEKILEVLGNIIDINKEQLLKTSVDTKLTDLGLLQFNSFNLLWLLRKNLKLKF